MTPVDTSKIVSVSPSAVRNLLAEKYCVVVVGGAPAELTFEGSVRSSALAASAAPSTGAHVRAAVRLPSLLILDPSFGVSGAPAPRAWRPPGSLSPRVGRAGNRAQGRTSRRQRSGGARSPTRRGSASP